MSIDRTTEILNYLSAISREVGEMRKEFNSRLEAIEDRLVKIEREQREGRRRLDRIESIFLKTRADVDELDERVSEIESKLA